MDLYQMMSDVEGKGEVDLPAWWQSKVTTAKNMMSGAKHYLDFEMKEPEIDAIVKVASDEDILDENIGKDEILAGRLYKIKNFVQPAFYQKVRSLINSGDLETAEFFIKRMEPAAAKNDMEMAKMMGDLEDIDKVAAQRQREKQIANMFVREKLTKDELKEVIKNSINEGDIDEGFFDRLKANIKGITAKTSTTFDNLKAFTRGDKEAIKDPKLAQNMAKLQAKAKTLDKELTDAMKDMATLFPKDVIAKTPEEFQTILSQYTQLLDKAKVLNTQISTGNYKSSSTTSTTTTPPTTNKPPVASTPPTTNKPPVASTPPTTNKPPVKPVTPPPTPSNKNQKMFNYKGKDYPLKTDKDGSFIEVGGTKIAVQPEFDPNKGTTSSAPTQKQPQARDAKGRFTSTKNIAEVIAKKLKETLYNPGEIHGEYEIGDIVSYNGEDHEVTRVEGDRIYIRPSEASAILGKKPAFWVKKDDLND
jgi:hypothetical protein